MTGTLVQCFFLFICVCLVKCDTKFVELSSPNQEEIKFMKKYGYLPDQPIDENEDLSFTPQSLIENIKKMQAFAGIPQSGVLDGPTKALFKKKRCGVKDIQADDSLARRRRYALAQGWEKKDITYNVRNGAGTLPKHRVELVIEKAFAMWAPHGTLTFQKKDHGSADIELSFSTGDHGDGSDFDGPGHVVAHAYPPPHGQIHFDDDELWSDNDTLTGIENDPDADSSLYTDLFAAALHEIGHALGLLHSDITNSVMYPYYQAPLEKLHNDDIEGMHKLYSESEEADGPPDMCDANYDTIQVMGGKIFVFEEDWMWVLSGQKELEPGYPKRFHDVFLELPSYVKTVRAIYQRKNGLINIFYGRKFWEFDINFQFIREGDLMEYDLPQQVDELTTVFLSNFNNKTYLINYGRFWRFDESSGNMDQGYPKSMAAWRKLPYPIDAALIWREDTYFFAGVQFWRFDNKLVQAHEYYPVPVAYVWFPCFGRYD